MGASSSWPWLSLLRTMWLIASSIFCGVRSSSTRSEASTESASIVTAVSTERGLGPG